MSSLYRAISFPEMNNIAKFIRNYLNYAPDDNEMRRLLGKILFDGGNRAGALNVYYTALMRDPGDFVARNNFAVALMYNRRSAEALREFLDAYENSGHEGFIGMNLCSAYTFTGEVEQAKRLREALGKQYSGKIEVPFDALLLGEDIGGISSDAGKPPVK